MTFVVDASIAVAWFLPDEQNEAGDELMADLANGSVMAPTLFWFEMRNLFLIAERRGRLGAGDAALSMAQLRALPIRDEGSGSDPLVLALATRRGLSGYEAAYLALAVLHALPLATTDHRMAVAARMEGVGLRGPLAAP